MSFTFDFYSLTLRILSYIMNLNPIWLVDVLIRSIEDDHKNKQVKLNKSEKGKETKNKRE
jgi:hypothetical protein